MTVSEIMEENRRLKSKKEIEKKRITREKQTKSKMVFHENFDKFLVEQQKKTGKTEDQLIDELVSSHFSIVGFDETLGKASLVFDLWKGMPTGEPIKVDQKTLAEFRSLRENFAPVSAGVEWHRDFTSGGGFLVQIDDPKDAHQIEDRNEIIKFCKNVYQDQYITGLDNILDIMMDTALTDGCAAAEILYEKEVTFEDYIDSIEEITLEDGKKVKVIKPKEMTNELWKDLGGITRLKIIDDAYTRLVPYRHPKSGEVLYWTLDEKTPTVNIGLSYNEITTREKKKPVIMFHPWEILWLSWNQRGTNLKGMSIIQPVYGVSKFVQAIQIAVGKGFNRWANKKYFFVCGSDKRPWNKIYREEFLKAMEKMIEKNWVGLPVPAGFDIKEIGGEQSVFEGESLLNHLIGMIAAGMQYPREFLEVGRTQASDKAWLAWTVRYGRSQLQIRRAIEHQLWKRHLYCKFGITYKESKKGVPVENQQNIPIYIPKLQWRAEGQWHRDTKMKTLMGTLNVASPIDQPLKLEVQKQMGETLGVGEIDWSEITELFSVENKIRIAKAKIEVKQIEAKLKMINEMSEEELMKSIQPQTQPQTPEEKLKEQTEKRLKGGVSRTTKEEGTTTKKGTSKPMIPPSGTRKISETIEMEIPQETIDKIKKEAIEEENVKVDLELKKTDLDIKKKKKKQLEKIEKEMEKIEKKDGEK